MNAQDTLKKIEEGYRKLCERKGLSLDDLFEMETIPATMFVAMVETSPPTKENQFHARKYMEYLITIKEDFLRLGAALALNHHGANADGIVLALQAITLASMISAAVQN
jgi:hypothetical protein